MPATSPIARGNTSDVWPWTETTVVKVLRPDIPAEWARIEADIVARVHAAGLPVPATDGVVDVDGRPGIVLERIDGDSMWVRMKRAPRRRSELVERLVDLQLEIQRTSVTGVPDLVARLAAKVDEARALPLAERREARELLASLPVGTALCHGDFHPANIVMAESGLIVLDWFDAAIGHQTADFVRSSLLMRPSASKGDWLEGATPELLDAVHRRYLAALVERGVVTADAFGAWEAAGAVARMAEPVPQDELGTIWRRWRAEGPTAANALLASCVARLPGTGDEPS